MSHQSINAIEHRRLYSPYRSKEFDAILVNMVRHRGRRSQFPQHLNEVLFAATTCK